MNNTSSKTPFIENQDLLLSCTLEDQHDFISETTLNLNNNEVNPSNFICLDQPVNQNEQSEVKDEIIDFNIFELLQADDPEMAHLLETVNSESVSYLPQLSINSTNKILGEITSQNQHVSLSEINSCNDLSELLLNKNNDQNKETTNIVNIKNPLTTPPLTPMIPSRVSMRLIKKRSKNDNQVNDEHVKSLNLTSFSSKIKQTNRLTNKRKRSIDDDEEDIKPINRNFFESNENSIDFEHKNETNFYNDDDSSSLNSYDSKQSYSNFKLSSRSKRVDSKELDPIKKESNKEAATRYRIKKSNEKEILFETRMNLEKENDQIKKRIELVQTEINYLKNMLVQNLLTKGLLNNSSGFEIF